MSAQTTLPVDCAGWYVPHSALSMVYLEGATDGLYLDEPADAERYNLMFRHLVARALGPDESRTMIAALAERMA